MSGLPLVTARNLIETSRVKLSMAQVKKVRKLHLNELFHKMMMMLSLVHMRHHRLVMLHLMRLHQLMMSRVMISQVTELQLQ